MRQRDTSAANEGEKRPIRTRLRWRTVYTQQRRTNGRSTPNGDSQTSRNREVERCSVASSKTGQFADKRDVQALPSHSNRSMMTRRKRVRFSPVGPGYHRDGRCACASAACGGWKFVGLQLNLASPAIHLSIHRTAANKAEPVRTMPVDALVEACSATDDPDGICTSCSKHALPRPQCVQICTKPDGKTAAPSLPRHA